VTMSAGPGRKRDGRPLSVRGTGMSVRMRARSRQRIAVPRLSSTSCPLRPASLPERARSSRARPPGRSRAAVTGPMPGMPLMPSDGSPASPVRFGCAPDHRGAITRYPLRPESKHYANGRG
jgi:hypothetical protein